MLKERDRLVNKSKSRCQKNIFDFEVEVPLTVKYALNIDQENGNIVCHKSIGKEMKNSRVSFNLLNKYNHDPVGVNEITYHLLFYIEMDLIRKAR